MAHATYCIVVLVLSVTVCLAADDTLRFIVIGDNGGTDTAPYTTPIELGTAARMAKVAEDVGGIHFVMELGDNFYNSGIKDVEDPRFQTTFEEVYTAPSLQVPFYMVAGNHDHKGNVSAEIMYSKLSSKWKFPDYYYPLGFKIPNSNASVDLVMIDTVRLCGMVDDEVNLQPLGPEDEKDAETQWGWIDQQLANSKATYLFTAGHYPIYSIAEHGPTWQLEALLLPKLRKYKASGHMSGHDHNLQHLQQTKHDVTLDFIVTGCADKMDPSTAHKDKVPKDTFKFHWADTTVMGGFVYIEASAASMVSTFIDANGKNKFEKVYTAPFLQVPWYMVARNHDHTGNVSTEIMYSKMSSKCNATVDFVMTDTVLLCGMVNDEVNQLPLGPENEKDAETQWEWIDQQLANSKATYLFTAGHYPIYSIAEHGPTKHLEALLLPKLRKYKASGHMCGHDHNLQHLQQTKDGATLDFIVTGCADKMDPSIAHKDSVPKDTFKFMASRSGQNPVENTQDRASFR